MKFKHKKTGLIAKPTEYKGFSGYVIWEKSENSVTYYKSYPKDNVEVYRIIPPELVEGSNDREEIKENPEYASNGMYIGDYLPNTVITFSLGFNTKENEKKRKDKTDAEIRIRKRKAENYGYFVEDWKDLYQRKYHFYYNVGSKELVMDYDIYKRTNNIYFPKEGAEKALQEIKDDLIIYLIY